jgi:hypothetical protein
MRKALIFILMATAATPLLAQSDDHKDRAERHQQQQQQQQQQQRPQGRQERQAAPQQSQPQRFQRQQQFQQQQPQGQQQQRFQRQQFQQAPQAQRFDRREQFQQQQVQGERRGNWNGGQSAQGRQGWQNRGDNRNWRGSGERGGVRWDRGWRNNGRYDWQRFRFSNRRAFHLGPYYAPYRGYGYNRLEIGIVLDSLFYGRDYWIDPSYYDLPPAPPGAEWVRYYNDVVLVDMYSGQVLDVIPDFFW